MAKSTESPRFRKAANERPPKPYPDFPLTVHPSGHWSKKIRRRVHYFGRWGHRRNGKMERVDGDGWKEALELYKEQADDLHAGRMPCVNRDGLTVAGLANHFLAFKKARVASGELMVRSFDDYYKTCGHIVRVFGKHASVESLNGDDFERLREDITKRRGPVALTTEIVRVRTVFNFAFKHGLIEKPIRYGAGFDPPTRKTMRKAMNASGPRMFEAAELRKIIETADVHLKAMTLLTANSGMGNHDIGCLPTTAVNFEAGWVDFPREKTGTPRRFPLWPETLDAIKASLARRPTPISEYKKLLPAGWSCQRSLPAV